METEGNRIEPDHLVFGSVLGGEHEDRGVDFFRPELPADCQAVLFKIGSRNPQQEKVREWLKKAGPKASAGTFAEAAAFGDIAVLAILWTGTENAVKLDGSRTNTWNHAFRLLRK